ncbi:MAG TPA: hypothetical protein VGP73_08355 [Thermoanaerobaculia bacterium]
MKILRWLLVLTPFLPLVVLNIPDGMTFMREPSDPWYTQYTSPVWMACAIFVYPVTAFLQVFGIQLYSATHFFGMALYVGAIAALFYRLLFRKPPNNALRPTGPHNGPAT